MTVPARRTARFLPPSPPGEDGGEKSLGRLREHLIGSRVERGPCPSFSQLRADFLPTVEARGGVSERREHLQLCFVCDHRVRAWRRSWPHAAEQAMAWSRIVAHHARVRGGQLARGASSFVGRSSRDAASALAAAHAAWRERRAVARAEARLAPRPEPAVRASEKPRRPSRPPIALPRIVRREPRSRKPLPPLVVLEVGPGLPDLTRLAAHVEARGGGLVAVPRVEEVLGDPDWKAVRAIVLAGSRPLAEWPAALARIERRAPGRTVRAVISLPAHAAERLSLRDDRRLIRAPLDETAWIDLLDHTAWPAAN